MGKGQGEREKGVAAEEDLTEIERKVDLEHTHTHASLWVFVRELLCVTDVSTLRARRGRGTHVDEKRWLQTQIYVI